MGWEMGMFEEANKKAARIRTGSCVFNTEYYRRQNLIGISPCVFSRRLRVVRYRLVHSLAHHVKE